MLKDELSKLYSKPVEFGTLGWVQWSGPLGIEMRYDPQYWSKVMDLFRMILEKDLEYLADSHNKDTKYSYIMGASDFLVFDFYEFQAFIQANEDGSKCRLVTYNYQGDSGTFIFDESGTFDEVVQKYKDYEL